MIRCGSFAPAPAAGFLAAAAPVYTLELFARFLVGLTIGGFWSIGAGLAGRLVPEQWTARATAVIFSAVPLGSVLGVPVGNLVAGTAAARNLTLAFAGCAALIATATLLMPVVGRTTAGALLGGLVVDASSVSVAMVCGGVGAVLTVGVLLWSRTQEVPGT
ncbi:hypothetical protein ACXC9Q_16170 [Kribbella sp. CWNU-51]